MKFTPRGGRIEILSRLDGNDVSLAVHDTGTGIPLAEQEQLFTRFFRSVHSREMQVPGTGLGLYIVNDIVTRHDGAMEVASSPRGSTFTMVLPVCGPHPAEVYAGPT